MKKEILRFEDFSVSYNLDGLSYKAIDGINFVLNKGEKLGIIGESGSGKTTIANSVMQLLPGNAEVEGRLYFENEDILRKHNKNNSYLWKDIALIFQNSLDVLNPSLTLGYQISESIIRHKLGDRSYADKKAQELLILVGLTSEVFNQYAHEISGGMRQRVLIAMALACNPKVLIADEITSALDAKTKYEILNLMLKLQKKMGFSLMLISHELDTIARLTDRLLVLYKGEILEKAPTKDFFGQQYHPYSRGLVNSSVSINIYKDLWGIPHLEKHNTDNKCPFYHRCTQRAEICKTEELKLVEINENRSIHCTRGGILDLLVGLNINKTFFLHNRQIRACIDCSLSIRHGEFLSIVGRSGSGKTTLANLISKNLVSDSGEVYFEKKLLMTNEASCRLDGIQMVYQDPFSSINERFTVKDAILEPLVVNKLLKEKDSKLFLEELLSRVELPNNSNFLKRRVFTLSGGQRQRIALVRALIMKPKLLIADEICSMLDKSTEANVLRMLKTLQSYYGFAMIYITHDLSAALKLSDNMIVMEAGSIVEKGNVLKIMKNPSHPYTRELVQFNSDNEKLLYF